VKGVQKCSISSAMGGTDNDSCEMAIKRKGMLGVIFRKMKTMTEDGDSDTD